MKLKRLGMHAGACGIVLALLLVGIMPAMAQVPDPVPVTSPLSGTVTIDGETAPDGSQVRVLVGDEAEARETGTGTVFGGEGRYEILLIGDGADVGKPLRFQVKKVGAADWIDAATDPVDPRFARYDPQTFNLTAPVMVVVPPPRYILTVTVDPTDSGTVNLNPEQPAEGYLDGTEVTLTATPAEGFRFDRWSGAVSGTDPTITVTMDAPKSVIAHFAAVPPPRYTLTVTIVPPASGTVTLAPLPGPDGRYARATTVTLVATPLAGFTFSHWTGDATGIIPTVSITMDRDKAVIAHFAVVVVPIVPIVPVVPVVPVVPPVDPPVVPVVPPTVEEVEAMPVEEAVQAVEAATVEEAVEIVAGVAVARAVEIVADVAIARAVEIVDAVAIARAVEIVAEVAIARAVEIVAEVTIARAVEIVDAVAIARAVEIVAGVAIGRAVEIVADVAIARAVEIVEEVAIARAVEIVADVAIARAVEIVEGVVTARAAGILEEVAVAKAAAVMEGLTTAKLTGVIPAMSELSLMERLPGLSADKLYAVDPVVLFASVPGAPTEHLVGEVAPMPPPVLLPPVPILVEDMRAEYRTPESMAGEWVVAMGSPMPVDKLLIKTKQDLTDVITTVLVLEELPAEVAVLPAEQVVSAYLSIIFENAAPEDIELGHMTFKVGREWLEQNAIHKWSVALSRYDPDLGRWISLPTRRVKEDDTYIYFSAIITRFSIFAISGRQVVPPLKFVVTDLVVNPAEVPLGQGVTIGAEITNISDTAGTYAATLWIDGTIEAGKDIFLQAGETAPVTFTVVRDVVASYKVRLDRLFGSFSVIKPLAPAAFTVTDLSITPEEVYPGEEVTISVLVTNIGELAGTYKVTLRIRGVVEATEKVTLAGGESKTVTFTVTRDIPATYAININGQRGTFEVMVPPPPLVIPWRLIQDVITVGIIVGAFIWWLAAPP